MESDRVKNTPQEGVSDGLRRRPPHGRPSGPTRRSTKGQWTEDEDEILCQAVHRYKGKNWKKIAECFKDRTDVQCLHRWQKVLNPDLVKGPWSKEEDDTIIELVEKYGAKKWSTIAQHLPGRIGKQCRERWHNHLNPTINKEAWTQEEELALIRAHQIYGNKWAELSKILPGRSDNSIKNHWNSSVKKKLDSYVSSGLLADFPRLPHVGQHNPPLIPSSYSNTQQSNGNDFGPKNGTEDISECSQGSTVFGCSQGTSDVNIIVLHTGNDSSQGIPGSSSSQQYYTPPEEENYYVPDIPFEVGCSYFEQDFSHETGTPANQADQFNLSEFHDMSSVELGQGVQANITHGPMHATLQAPIGIESSSMLEHIVTGSNQLEDTMRYEGVCGSAIFPEEATHGFNSSGNFQVCETAESSAPQAYYPARSDILRAHEDQYSANYGTVPIHLEYLSIGTQEHRYDIRAHEDFRITNNSGSYPDDSDADNNIDLQEQENQIDPSEYLVPIDDALNGSNPSDVNPEEHNMGSLCYKPPRFPSLDLPFLSCDLAQSGSDMQQEFSPLGIRQLMLNCSSPFRYWESPSRDGNSPEALLKSAAKTFTNTPSIMKKRNRDLLSPLLSEKRSDKKIGRDFAQRTLSGLAKNFSSVDVMFRDQATSPSSVHIKSLGASIED